MNIVTFVILHYLGLEDTVECIESITNNVNYTNYSIVIVDNASPNNSGKELKEKYENEENIYVILNEHNLGFARGNNEGFIFAKKHLKTEFIIMINNDTIIEQNDFIEKIIYRYNKEKFHVMGPDIISLIDNGHQNPQDVELLTKNKVKKILLRLKILLFFNIFNLDGIVKKLYSIIKSDMKESNNYDCEMKEIQLHGSSLIFSPEYIKQYDGLYDKTFMYMEEEILRYICERDNLIMLYYPKVKIYHKEDSATNKVYKKSRLKNRFIYRNCIKSTGYLMSLMEQEM